MPRRSQELDPEVVADLAALDAALAGERDDPELALIVSEARAWAPPMAPAFATKLDEAVAGGFGRPPRAARKWVGWRAWSPALGFAAAVLVALVVVGNQQDGNEPSSSSAGGAASAGGATTQKAIAPADADAGVGAAGRESVASPPTGARRVERAAELTLTTPADRLQDTADGVVRVVDRAGGYVERSDIGATGGGGDASFDLRVPSAHLQDTIAALSRLGHVRSRSEHAQDITGPTDDAIGRLHDARAERKALLRALARASTAQQAESLRARLRIVRSEIAAARGDVASLRRRADFAHVAVTVVGRKPAAGGATGGDGRWTPGDAVRDSVRVLGVAAGVAIVALAALVPMGLLAAMGLLGGRTMRRRRREAVLDRTSPAV